MIDPLQFRALIVRPALQALELHSPAAENLVMGTAAQESRLQFLHQLGGGPALGVFQMEPATHSDIWTNYLRHRPRMVDKVLDAIEYDGRRPGAWRMVHDLRYAAIMCRLHYRRVPEKLPDAYDIEALAVYWKRYYNTAQGRGTVDEFMQNYEAVA